MEGLVLGPYKGGPYKMILCVSLVEQDTIEYVS